MKTESHGKNVKHWVHALLVAMMLLFWVKQSWSACSCGDMADGKLRCPASQCAGSTSSSSRAPTRNVYPCPVPTDPSSCNRPSGGYSGGSRVTPGDINAIGNAIGNLLDSSNAAAEREQERQRQYEMQRQRQQAEEQHRQMEEQRKKQQIQAQTNQLLNAAASDPSLDPWANPPKPEKSDESPPKLTNCDCAKIVGACQGSVRATPTSSTKGSYGCQSAFKFDHPSASNFDQGNDMDFTLIFYAV